jgi:hypothetical protein
MEDKGREEKGVKRIDIRDDPEVSTRVSVTTR